MLIALTGSLGALALGIIGLIIGGEWGGNHCTSCQFNGQLGYEATGQIGFLMGAPVGLLSSSWVLAGWLKARNRRRNR